MTSTDILILIGPFLACVALYAVVMLLCDISNWKD